MRREGFTALKRLEEMILGRKLDTLVAPLTAFAAVGLMALTSPALAQSSSNPLSHALSSLLGTDDEVPAINYSERPALVVPARRDVLPPPGQAASLDTDPNWPKDPDELKRSRQKGGGRVPVSATGSDPAAPVPLLHAGELDPPDAFKNRARGYTAEQMKQIRHAFDHADGHDLPPVQPGVEPTRASLVDPPAGMRVPSANASLDATAKLPSELDAEQHKKNWWDKLF